MASVGRSSAAVADSLIAELPGFHVDAGSSEGQPDRLDRQIDLTLGGRADVAPIDASGPCHVIPDRVPRGYSIFRMSPIVRELLRSIGRRRTGDWPADERLHLARSLDACRTWTLRAVEVAHDGSVRVRLTLRQRRGAPDRSRVDARSAAASSSIATRRTSAPRGDCATRESDRATCEAHVASLREALPTRRHVDQPAGSCRQGQDPASDRDREQRREQRPDEQVLGEAIAIFPLGALEADEALGCDDEAESRSAACSSRRSGTSANARGCRWLGQPGTPSRRCGRCPGSLSIAAVGLGVEPQPVKDRPDEDVGLIRCQKKTEQHASPRPGRPSAPASWAGERSSGGWPGLQLDVQVAIS